MIQMRLQIAFRGQGLFRHDANRTEVLTETKGGDEGLSPWTALCRNPQVMQGARGGFFLPLNM